MQIEMTRDGHKNVVYIVSGTIDAKSEKKYHITSIDVLDPRPSAIRLDNLIYAVEDGLKAFLKWQGTDHIVPLEGRGRLLFEDMGGLSGVDIDLEVKGVGALFLMLDISKLGV